MTKFFFPFHNVFKIMRVNCTCMIYMYKLWLSEITKIVNISRCVIHITKEMKCQFSILLVQHVYTLKYGVSRYNVINTVKNQNEATVLKL